MVEQGLLFLALVVPVLSVPYALLSAVYLAGADDTANNAFASLLGVLLIAASIRSVLAVYALVKGDPWASTRVVLFAPAVLAAISGRSGAGKVPTEPCSTRAT